MEITKQSWNEVITNTSVAVFGEGSCTPSSDGKQLYIKKNGVSVAIFQNKENRTIMHIRAGLTPNMAGFITSIFFLQLEFSLGENFELDSTGHILHGEEALRYVARNAEELWFGSTGKANKELSKTNSEIANSRVNKDTLN